MSQMTPWTSSSPIEGETQEGKAEYIGDFNGVPLLRIYTEDGNSLVSSHKGAFGLFYV